MITAPSLLGKLREKLEDGHIKEVLSGSVIAFTFRMASYVLGYGFALIVSRHYGTRGMGIYSLSLSLLMILEMLGTLGMKTSILRYAGQYASGTGNETKLKGLYRTVLGLVLPVSLALSVLLFLFSPQIAHSFFHHEALAPAFRITSFIAPFYCVDSLNMELIRGLRNIKLSEFLRNINKSFLSIAFLFAVRAVTSGPYVPLIAFSLGTLVGSVFSFFLASKRTGLFSGASASLLGKGELIRTSLPMMITGFSFLIMGKIDTVMIAAMGSVEEVGIYSIALRLAATTSFILASINAIAAPKFAELYWAKNYKDLHRVVRFSSRIIFFFSFPLLLVMTLFPGFMMGLFGRDFTAGKTSLVFLTVGQFINAASGSVGNLLNMTGGQKVFRNIVLTAAVMNVLLNYLLIPVFGITGAAMATMISMVFWNLASVGYVYRTSGIQTFYLPLLCR